MSPFKEYFIKTLETTATIMYQSLFVAKAEFI